MFRNVWKWFENAQKRSEGPASKDLGVSGQDAQTPETRSPGIPGHGPSILNGVLGNEIWDVTVLDDKAWRRLEACGMVSLVFDAPTHLQNQKGGGFRVSGWSYVVVVQNTCPQNGHRS